MNFSRASSSLEFVLLALTLSLSPALAAEKHPAVAAPKPPAAKAPAPQTKQQDPHPGDRALRKLQEMTPAEREKWLSKLPPEQRQKIEKSLQTVAKMPPADQSRIRERLERLNNLPQQRQGQVRRSLKQFNDMEPERRAVISQELQRITAMPDEQRRAHMNSEEFRNRYSPMEQQMMANLSEILP
jgi:hypothetical protein